MPLDVSVGDGVAVLTLDEPPVNALSTALYEELADTLTQLGDRTDVRALVVASANSRVFCAGADVREFAARPPGPATRADELRQILARRVYDLLLDFPYPTVAAVRGPALGAGAVLVACCDLRVGGPSTVLGLPEVDVVRCGGGRHLMRILPQGLVRQMYFTGERLPADTARAYGALNEVVDDEAVLDRASALAAQIAGKSAVALRAAKSALNAAEPKAVSDGYFVEQLHTLRLLGTADAAEATTAFADKRTPRWSHQ
ncbi:enoyl-CoA hydratase-related protein [Streptomyces sp. NPDC001984]